MNIREIEYFHDLVKQKNFSLVAKNFQVSQPTITLAIKRLEKELGATLFTRDPGRNQLRVTISGQQFDEHAISILHHLKVAQNEINNINQQKIVLGLPPIITQKFFPSIAAKLEDEKLLEQIIPIERGSAELIKLLENGTIDMALLGSTSPIDHEQLYSQEFARSSFKIIVGDKSPFANKKKIRFSELRNESFITLDEQSVHAKAIKQFSHMAHFRPKIIYQSNNPGVVQKMVENNVGIGFISEIAIFQRVHVLDLVDDDQPVFHISLAYRNDHLLTPAQQEIVEVITGLEGEHMVGRTEKP
ncbi:LysR family transcriptional regulator [Pediococcus argentinicus]|uniref:MleR protein n=1 Tax=Pediococcus argentinicus TaxID=480391 RepID=A0A0R2NN68_9LACO|nr:LysR family transcriptional regulator [Pediococcus argentinicus]KRO26123.1 mleR protein [Pediococcus argentinicus]NKZ21668.1 LysR family transcriptional regulator [Pediococcus argentinicus]GEP18743.1 LysR family transcriptional regulator [Pediococcus argentinicus]